MSIDDEVLERLKKINEDLNNDETKGCVAALVGYRN